MQQDWNLGGFEPYNDSHAIVMASINIQFQSQLDDTMWAAVRSSIIEAGERLDVGPPQPFYGMSLVFDQTRVSVNLNSPSPIINETGGLSFTTVGQDDNIIERFVAAKDSLTIQTGSYVRWNSFFSRANEFLEILLPKYKESINLNSVKCEYWDRFDHRGPGEPNPLYIIRRDSPFLTSAAVKEDEAWHSYCGFFTATGSTRRLTNARIDCADFPTKGGERGRSIIIHTMLQDIFSSNESEPSAGNGPPPRSVFDTLESQHSELKANLSRIITDSAAARIRL